MAFHPLMIRKEAGEDLQHGIHGHLSITAIRVGIIAWALFTIILALYIDNPLVLAGILAWEILP
jgi:hypothetical protein